MELLESHTLVQSLLSDARVSAAALVDRGIDPHLAVVLVGEHPDSLKYIDIKTEKGVSVGITVSLYHLEADASDSEI